MSEDAWPYYGVLIFRSESAAQFAADYISSLWQGSERNRVLVREGKPIVRCVNADGWEVALQGYKKPVEGMIVLITSMPAFRWAFLP